MDLSQQARSHLYYSKNKEISNREKGELNMNKNKFYDCFSLRLAGYLLGRGFVPLEMRTDTRSNRKIIVFRNSDELIEATIDYKQSK